MLYFDQMFKPKEIKQLEIDFWASNAAEYDARLGAYSARFAADLVDYLYPQKWDRALDIAGGSGATGLKLADRIGPEGSVLMIDLSAEMLRIASRKAAARKHSNLKTRVMDAERLDLPPSSCDLITCAFAATSFPDVPRAVAEMMRVLKPGGRLGFAVWSRTDRFPLFTKHAAAIASRVTSFAIGWAMKLPAAGPLLLRRAAGRPGPWGLSPLRFGPPGSLESELLRAGFHEVRRETRAFPIDFSTFDDYWNAATRIVPLHADCGSLLPRVREILRRDLADHGEGKITLWNEAAIVLAKKPV